MAIVVSVVIGAVALAVGALLGYVIKFRVSKGQVEGAERSAAYKKCQEDVATGVGTTLLVDRRAA